MKDRVILHSDLNSFFASVECMKNPEIKGKPVAVVGDPELRHGIVLAKNERAKSYGVKTGHVIWEARQLCPNLVTVRANYDSYVSISHKVRSIYESYTDRVESFGIDECWLDVSGLDGKKTADEIRARIKRELGITASIGVSWNKIYAKLASDLKKPNATVVISRENYKQAIFDLPAEYLLYVGKSTRERLYKYNIRTIGDIAASDAAFLRDKFGKWGDYLYVYACGMDTSTVLRGEERAQIKSVGNSSTTVRDLKTIEEVHSVLTVLAESVSFRLREKHLKGRTVHLEVLDNLFNKFAKQRRISAYTNVSADIIDEAMKIFVKSYDFRTPIRSLGVRVSDIVLDSEPMQISFFETLNKKPQSLQKAVDSIREKYGHFAINRGVELVDKGLTIHVMH